jgi:amino acid adenylation domain-containing protein
VVELFVEQAATSPSNVAIVDGERELSYGELDAASSRLARHLIGLGVGPEAVVGVCLERSASLIVALLGIWKAGGAYLPLDSDYPAERLSFMMADARASLVVTSASSVDGLSEAFAGSERVVLDAAKTMAQLEEQPGGPVTDAERLGSLTPSSLAYVIYTSGSTGQPKGVQVSLRALAARLLYFKQRLSLTPADRLLNITSFAFDGAIRELFLWFVAGGTLVVGPKEGARDVKEVIEQVNRERITALRASPSQIRTMLKHLNAKGSLSNNQPVFSTLEHVLIGGEGAKAQDVNEFRHTLSLARGTDLLHVYGSTEAQDSLVYACRDEETDPVPIGTPISNTRAYVVDERLQPQPIGVVGELLIGGVQVSRGYLGRSGLTAERFIADPFSGEAGSRLYRSGDLARWRPDGTLEFLGRIDDQVKIRGMRVEPGEIEAALLACEGIEQAVVVAQEGEDGDRRLVAYVVPQEVPDADQAGVQAVNLDGLVDLETVRTTLKDRLPEYMIPAGYVGLSRLPLTASGKVDRRGLPTAEVTVSRAAYMAPHTQQERLVAEVFSDLLDVADPGVDDSFFDLGGHSLLAVRLVVRLSESTGRELAVRTVFESPTVAGLASALDKIVLLPTEDAIALLKEDPASAKQFEAVFGLGSAKNYLSKKNPE